MLILYIIHCHLFQGVIPATIAIKDGVFRAGLHPDELENLSKAGEEGRAIKCSTRDLPLVASNHIMSTSEENVQWGGRCLGFLFLAPTRISGSL